MKKYQTGIITTGMMLLALFARGQEKPAVWDLKSCIEYARNQNIQIRQSRLACAESVENTRQAEAERLPSLSFSSAHNYINRPRPEAGDKNSYSGTYGLNSSVSLYGGGRLKKNIEQMTLRNQVQELTVREAENNIELAITQAFVQVLYAHESVEINAYTVEVSEVQLNRGRELMAAGALSVADVAQLEAQYTSGQYQWVVAKTALANAQLELKQLLELGLQEEMQLVIPVLPDEEVLTALPSKEGVYLTALSIMPEIRYNQLNIKVAGVQKEQAGAGFWPELTLSAGIGSSHASGGWNWGNQMKHNWSENVGLTLNIPVFSNRSNRTAVNLAKLNIENAKLEYESVQKDLLKSVETVYQDAVSAQDRFRSARENLKAVELSFQLTQEQFFLGMKNTLEMLTEKNNLLTARQEMIQAKYMAILNQQLLNFYQGKEISIE